MNEPGGSLPDLDALILSFARPRWQKVARLIGDAAEECERKGINASDEEIADRIRKLVDDRKLQGAGNLYRWGYSEVRLFLEKKAPPSLDLDALVLSLAWPEWQRVEQLIINVSKDCELMAIDVSGEVVADHIRKLVNDGKLEARGSLADWRRSEVRLPE
jgi:hypothetical protein